MADKRLFDGLDDEVALELKLMLAGVAESGALERYAQTVMLDVALNSTHQTDLDLLESIRRAKADTQGIMAMHHFGLKLAQELKGNNNVEEE